MNRKLLTLFCIVIIINLTPAFALNMAGIQNDVNYIDNYAHSGFWYKFWNFFSFTNTIAGLCSKIADFANEIPYHLQRGMEVMPKVLESRKELDQKNEKLHNLAAFYSNNTIKESNKTDTKELTLENTVNTSDNLNNTNLTSNNTNMHHTALVNTETNNISSSNPNENKSSLKSKVSTANESSNTTSTKKFSSITKKSITKTPPKEAVDHANYIKSRLISKGIDVNIVNLSFEDLKKDDILQLVDIQGFIKYMVYEGDTTLDNEAAVILYNGQDDQIVKLHKFQKAYTGEILELTNNNDSNIMSTDVADEIYSDTLNILSTKISAFKDWVGVGNALAWIGGCASSITALIGCAVAVIVWCLGEKAVGTAAAAIIAIISGIIIVAGLIILGVGLIITFVLQKNLDDTTKEQDDLTSHCI